MLSNKLITLLKSFSSSDLLRFRKYLVSPFFNENENLTALYDLLFPYLKNKEEIHPPQISDKRAVWKTLFPKEPYKDVKMRRLCSDLTKHGLSFLSIQQFKDTPLAATTYLLDPLNDAALSKQYEHICRAANEVQNTSDINNTDYYFYKYQIQWNQYQFKLKKRTPFVEDFRKADHYLDCYYYLNKLRNYCDELQIKNTTSTEDHISKPQDLFDYLEKEQLLKIPSIRAYYYATQMFLQSDEGTNFQQLKELVLATTTFSRNDLYNLFNYLMNYCVRKINAGNQDFFYQLFDLYKIALDKKVLLDKDRLDFQHYKNIIGISLKVKEYDWAEFFIQNYTKYLNEDTRDNALNFNLAKLYFSQQQYDKVIEQLSTVQYNSHLYALGCKTILLKTYFELQEYQALDSLIDSFRIYIRRNQFISKEVKQQYLNLLRFTKKLAGTIPKDKPAIKKITNQIQNCKALAGKNWVLEKVNELV